MTKIPLKLVFISLGLFLITIFAINFAKENLQFTVKDTADKFIDEFSDDESVEIYGEYSIDPEKGLFISKFVDSTVEYIDQNESDQFATTKSLVDENNYLSILNAGYFQQDFSHAGLLIKDGIVKTILSAKDKQLTHVVRIGDNIELYSAVDFSNLKENLITEDTYFQTGPLVVLDNEIQIGLIRNSLNGNGDYTRSLLGFSKDGDIFLIYTNRRYDLIKLSEMILEDDLLVDEIVTIVNLDGGPSVSSYSIENDRFSFQEVKKMPFYIGVNLK